MNTKEKVQLINNTLSAMDSEGMETFLEALLLVDDTGDIEDADDMEVVLSEMEHEEHYEELEALVDNSYAILVEQGLINE